MDLRGASFFAVLASDDDPESTNLAPEWHSSNIYSIERAPSRIVQFPIPPSSSHPTKYHILISADYEVFCILFVFDA